MNCPQCKLESDYIPKGGPVTKIANLRPANHFAQCGAVIGDDPQSGPLYCGDRATLLADSIDENGRVDGLIAVCKRHETGLKEMEQEQIRKAKKAQEELDKVEAECSLWDGH